MMLKELTFFAIVSVMASAVVVPCAAWAGEHPTIRVAVMRGEPQVTVGGVRATLSARAGDADIISAGHTEVSLRAVGNALRVDGVPVPGDEVVITAKPAAYRIGQGMYRGVIRVYVDAPGSLLVVNELDIEDYLAGLINSEISSNWPIEAVKAQAIAARTYALNQIAGAHRNITPLRYDVESTVADQVYHGAHREDKRAYEGVRATTGAVLTRGGVIFPSFYHSACGGYTEYAHNVWSGMSGGAPTVDRYCRRSPHAEWFLRIPRAEFISMLTAASILGSDELLMAISRTPLPDSPRAGNVVLTTDRRSVEIKATDLRRLLGYQRLKSTWFNVGLEGDAVVFGGRGFGHGVGLCQWGAKGMAEAGYTYRDILKHYYGDAEIGRMY